MTLPTGFYLDGWGLACAEVTVPAGEQPDEATIHEAARTKAAAELVARGYTDAAAAAVVLVKTGEVHIGIDRLHRYREVD